MGIWQHCTNFQLPIFAQLALTYAKFNTSWYKNTEFPSCSPDKYNNLNHSTVPVAFSGRPPTKIVLQPGGRSRVVGGGAFGVGGKSVKPLKLIRSLGTREGSWGIMGPLSGGPSIWPSGPIWPIPIILYCNSSCSTLTYSDVKLYLISY